MGLQSGKTTSNDRGTLDPCRHGIGLNANSINTGKERGEDEQTWGGRGGGGRREKKVGRNRGVGGVMAVTPDNDLLTSVTVDEAVGTGGLHLHPLEAFSSERS